MITLTFETWEEFDSAISGIVSIATELAKPEQGYTPTPYSCVLTIFICIFFTDHVSYILAKYSDFGRSDFKIFFRFPGYQKGV